jgi:hypothetical protein
MDLDDEDLEKVRLWMRRLLIPLEKTESAKRAWNWRNLKRGYLPRTHTDYKTDKVFACCKRPITPENTRIDKNGQKSCRLCQNKRIRLWRARRWRKKCPES